MTDNTRRSWIKKTLTGSALLVMSPTMLVAKNKTDNDLNAQLSGVKDISGSGKIIVDVPVFAEATSSVPVAVLSKLPNTRSIEILISKNTPTSSARFEFKGNTLPKISTRVKIAEATDVIALVTTDKGRFSAKVDVMSQSPDGCFGSDLPNK